MMPPMKTKDDRIGVRLEPELKKEVERRAEKEGMSAGAIVRMAVRIFLEPAKKGKS